MNRKKHNTQQTARARSHTANQLPWEKKQHVHVHAVRHKRVRRERNAQLQQRQRRNVLNVNCMWIVNAFEFMFVLYDMYMYFFPLYFFNLGGTRLCECMCVCALLNDVWGFRQRKLYMLYALYFIHTFHPLNEIAGSISFMFWEEAICIEVESVRKKLKLSLFKVTKSPIFDKRLLYFKPPSWVL